MSKDADSRQEIRELLRSMRKEVQKFSKDLSTATQKAVESTEKTVRDVSPKVTSTFDEVMSETSVAFRRVMGNIDRQTSRQQVKLLQTYKTFLAKQAEAIDKRLRKLSPSSPQSS